MGRLGKGNVIVSRLSTLSPGSEAAAPTSSKLHSVVNIMTYRYLAVDILGKRGHSCTFSTSPLGYFIRRQSNDTQPPPADPRPQPRLHPGAEESDSPCLFLFLEEIKVGWLYAFTLSLFYFIIFFFLHEDLITKPMMTHDPVFHVFLVM